jgi:hypothetical protein
MNPSTGYEQFGLVTYGADFATHLRAYVASMEQYWISDQLTGAGPRYKPASQSVDFSELKVERWVIASDK